MIDKRKGRINSNKSQFWSSHLCSLLKFCPFWTPTPPPKQKMAPS